jgi:hypothetical protein
MRQKAFKRGVRRIGFGARAVQLALLGTGLVTAIAAAQIVAKPAGDDMDKAVAKQQIAEGQAVTPQLGRGDRPAPMTNDQMLTSAASYEGEMNQAVAHGETQRLNAYRSKDIIRMTCIDDKLGQMKEVVLIAKPRFTSIKESVNDSFNLRAQFTTIQTGWERVNKLAKEIEVCVGDSLDATDLGIINEARPDPSHAIDDPNRPADPTSTIDRPTEASPFK